VDSSPPLGGGQDAGGGPKTVVPPPRPSPAAADRRWGRDPIDRGTRAPAVYRGLVTRGPPRRAGPGMSGGAPGVRPARNWDGHTAYPDLALARRTVCRPHLSRVSWPSPRTKAPRASPGGALSSLALSLSCHRTARAWTPQERAEVPNALHRAPAPAGPPGLSAGRPGVVPASWGTPATPPLAGASFGF